MMSYIILKEKKKNDLNLSYKLQKHEALIFINGNDIIFKYKIFDNETLQISNKNNSNKNNNIKFII